MVWGAVGNIISLLMWSTAEFSSRSCWWDVENVGGTSCAFLSHPSGAGAATASTPTVLQFSRWRGGLRPASLSPCRVEQIGLNATNTFLVYTEEDLGDLLKIRLTWERTSQSWYNLWKELRSYLSQPRRSEEELNIRRIRVKSGETQRK